MKSVMNMTLRKLREDRQMLNDNFLEESIQNRKELLKSVKFRIASIKVAIRDIVLSSILLAIIGWMFWIGQKYDWIILAVAAVLLFWFPAYTLGRGFVRLMLLKVPTDEYLHEVGEFDDRTKFLLREPYNTNLFDILQIKKLEYKEFYLVLEDGKSYIYNMNEILLTSSPIVQVTTEDRSYNQAKEKLGSIKSERIKDTYTKVVFADKRFMTFHNLGSQCSKALERAVV